MPAMDHSLKTGVSFGVTSGIITTLGMMVGLHTGTHSRTVVIAGILTIAVADAFSDALGIHISEESENVHTDREIWVATLATFFAKFFCALTFLVPIVLVRLETAVWISGVWGLGMLAVFSWLLAVEQERRRWPVVLEHLAIAVVVIGLTRLLGGWLSRLGG